MIRKKAVIVHTDFRSYWPARLVALSQYLAERGYDLTVIEIAGKGSPYDFAQAGSALAGSVKWIQLFDADLRALAPQAMSERVFAALDEIGPDVVLAGAIAFPSGATAVRWARTRRRPVMIMDNARQQDVPRGKLSNWVKNRIYRNVDAVLIPAESHVESFELWGLNRAQMFFGVDVVDNHGFARMAAQGKSDVNWRERLGLPTRFFTGVGRQVAKKNWHTVLAAYSRYRTEAKGSAWDLVLVGDGPEQSQLKGIVATQSIKGVHFVPFLDPRDLCVVYAHAGALVMPSYYGETWGLVVNEAMACGLPVLVSDQCGCSQTLVKDGRNGWQFPPNDADHLAGLMSKMAALSESEHAQFSEASREIIADWPLKRFCDGAWEAIEFCQDTERGFDSVIGRILLHIWKGRFRPT